MVGEPSFDGDEPEGANRGFDTCAHICSHTHTHTYTHSNASRMRVGELSITRFVMQLQNFCAARSELGSDSTKRRKLLQLQPVERRWLNDNAPTRSYVVTSNCQNIYYLSKYARITCTRSARLSFHTKKRKKARVCIFFGIFKKRGIKKVSLHNISKKRYIPYLNP